MKRKSIRVIVVLLVLIGLPLGALRMFFAYGIGKELAAIRAAGLPASGEELNRWYPAVPDAQNAALVLTQAFALRRNYPDSRSNLINNFKLPKRSEALSPEQVALLRGHLALNDARLKKADEALKLRTSRYPIDCSQLMNTLLPHLAWLKDLVELHQYSASLPLESGNATAASSNLVTMLVLAGTLDNEPCLISQFVRMKLFGMVVTSLEHRANAGRFSAEEIALLTRAFSNADQTGASVRGLIGDRAMTIPYFTITQAELARIRPPSVEPADVNNSPLPCHGSAMLRLMGYYQLDYGSYLIYMRKGLELLSNAPPTNLKASGFFGRAGGISKQRHRLLSAQTLSAYAFVAARENQAVAMQRLALTALALETFRNENGRLPEELEVLVPKFLNEMPVDPFTGLGLEYRRQGKGYVIYSVGRDQEDNGGLEESNKKLSEDGQSYDITFIVER